MTKELQAIVEKIKGKLVAVASTEDKDRMGDVVKADGWVLKNFKKNPVLLFAHKYNEPPIGIAKNLKVEGTKLMFEPVFHEITQLAREVKAMFVADPPIMKAFSVGFLPIEIDKEDWHKILKQELLEISAVPVPANAQALALASKSYSGEEEKEVNKWVNEKNKEMETVEKPYPNEHSCRLESPDKYKKFRRQTCAVKSSGKCIDFIFGILAAKKSELQAMRYKKDIWTADSARAHCKGKDGTFEAATKEVEEQVNSDRIEKIIKKVLDKIMPKVYKDISEYIDGMKHFTSDKVDAMVKEKVEEVEQELILLKEGRVISGKNRKKISNAIITLQTAIVALKDLLKISEPSVGKEGQDGKGRREVAPKSRENRIIVRALQKHVKNVNNLLHEIKNYGP